MERGSRCVGEARSDRADAEVPRAEGTLVQGFGGETPGRARRPAPGDNQGGRAEPPASDRDPLHRRLRGADAPIEGADGRVPRERRASTARDARQVPAVTPMADPMRGEEVTLKDGRLVVIRPSRLRDAQSLLRNVNLIGREEVSILLDHVGPSLEEARRGRGTVAGARGGLAVPG